MTHIFYRQGELHKMDLKAKLETVTKEYQEVLAKLRELETTKSQLMSKGILLEGKLAILQEQITELAKPVEPDLRQG